VPARRCSTELRAGQIHRGGIDNIDGQAARAHDEGFGERQKSDRLIFAIGFLTLAVAFMAQNWLGTLPAIFAFILCVGPSLMEALRGSKGNS